MTNLPLPLPLAYSRTAQAMMAEMSINESDVAHAIAETDERHMALDTVRPTIVHVWLNAIHVVYNFVDRIVVTVKLRGRKLTVVPEAAASPTVMPPRVWRIHEPELDEAWALRRGDVLTFPIPRRYDAMNKAQRMRRWLAPYGRLTSRYQGGILYLKLNRSA